VILYADRETDSIRATVAEVERRRERQAAYNAEHGIVPQTIIKPIRDSIEALYDMDYVEVEPPPVQGERVAEDPARAWPLEKLRGEVLRLREEMLHAAEELRFEDAAGMRDRLRELEQLELAR
jgi:excinuclease ABC subunit B